MGGGQPGGAGTPGSGVDNFSTETAVDASANGQGTVANKFIIDGLNVTSGIRQGVLNLTPNPDAIQETSASRSTPSRPSTAAAARSRWSARPSRDRSGSTGWSATTTTTTACTRRPRSWGRTTSTIRFTPTTSRRPSAGPIVPKKQLFFFFAVEPLRSSASTGNQTIFFPDPQFASWARQNYPNTFGTKILNTYVPTGVTGTIGVANGRATSSRPPAAPPRPTTCRARLPMIDSGDLQLELVPRRRPVFRSRRQARSRTTGSTAASSGRTLDYGGPNVIPQFSTTNHNTQYAFQLNHTHVFSPNTLNEAIFASNRIEGFIGETGDFTIPNIGVTGLSVGYGVGLRAGQLHPAQLSVARRADARPRHATS